MENLTYELLEASEWFQRGQIEDSMIRCMRQLNKEEKQEYIALAWKEHADGGSDDSDDEIIELFRPRNWVGEKRWRNDWPKY